MYPLTIQPMIRIAHQRSDLEHLDSGVFMPPMTDSRMPGTNCKYSVSFIEFHACSESRIALARLLVILIGWRDFPALSIRRSNSARAFVAVKVFIAAIVRSLVVDMQ